MRRKDMEGYTLSQLLSALNTEDPNDPHAGGIPIHSIAQIEEMYDF